MNMMLPVRVRASLVAGVLLALGSLWGLAVSGRAATDRTETVTFATAGEHPFTVPAGVTSLHVAATGGQGGTGASYFNPQIAGGTGATVTGNLSVTPGEALYAEVGGDGTNGAFTGSTAPGAGQGGVNGGGDGGGTTSPCDHGGGGGGGGASDIRTLPSANSGSLATRLIVAAGGGGGGSDDSDFGGGTGGNAGSNGADGSGGAPGSGGIAGSAGLGQGGVGGTGCDGGGGGGGGQYGGGGGSAVGGPYGDSGGGGGGGGTNLVPAGGSAGAATGAPEIQISFADTTAPSVSLKAVPTPSRDTTPAFVGTASTALGDRRTVIVRVYPGKVASGTPTEKLTARVNATTGAYHITATPLVDGTYTAQASQSDQGGLVGTSAAHSFVVDTTPPAITITTPASGATYAKGQRVLARYSCTDRGSGVATCVGPVAVGAPIDTSADGTHTFTVSSSDHLGNSASKSVTYTVEPATPKLRHLQLHPRAFRPATRGGAVIHSSDVGAKVSYQDTLKARTTFRVYRRERGVRRGRSCVRPSHGPRQGKAGRCTRLVLVGSFTHADHAGTNRFRFSGRVHRRALSPGNYVLKATAKLAGQTSHTISAGFSILPLAPNCQDRDHDGDCDAPGQI